MKIVDFQTICNFIDYGKVRSGLEIAILLSEAAHLLSTSEHVLLKEYTTGFIPIIFVYQTPTKNIRMSRSPIETPLVIIFYTFIIFYTTFTHQYISLSIHWLSANSKGILCLQ